MKALSQIHTEVPGGIYLCQVSETISCGACCGLYNVKDALYENLEKILFYRTDAFSAVPRNPDGILNFKLQIEKNKVQKRPYPDFDHCSYIGFIGKHRSRVGCLLHPWADGNKGVDFRGLSYYGGMACNVYFCPSHRSLKPIYKKILQQAAPDWYLYGLMITESEMVESFFQAVERRLQRPLKEKDFSGNQASVETLRAFLKLKLDWPYRSSTCKGPANYFFKDPKSAPPAIQYESIGEAPSRYDPILRALNTVIDSGDDLRNAEDAIKKRIERLQATISK